MGADEALLALGMVGRWQVLSYALTLFAYLFPCVNVFFTSYVIWFPGHDFLCERKNTNLTLDESFPVQFDPEIGQNVHSKCERYVTSSAISNMTETCDAWTYNPYPFQWTAVIEWDLVCDKAPYLETAVIVIQLAGSGSFFLAFFPDWFGRRRSLLVIQTIMSIFLVATAFATSPRLMSTLQFFYVFFMSGGITAGSILAGEMFPHDVRVYTTPIQDIFFCIVIVIWVLLLYLVRDLRKLQLVVACLSIIDLILYRWCPESVRWLAANQRYGEAQKILDHAARMNKVSRVDPTVLKSTEATSSRPSLSDTDTPTMLKYLRRRRTCLYFFVLYFNSFSTLLGFGGLNILIQLLSGDLFLNYIIFALLGIPGVVVAVCLMHFFGRRYALISLFTFAGLSMATAAVCQGLPAGSLEPGTRKTLVTTFALLSNIAMNGMFSGTNLYAQDIFPTAIRSTGFGILAGLSILGSLLGPVLVLFLSRTYSLAFPIGIMAVLFLLSAILSVTLPEVLGRPLPETIQEVVDWPRTLCKEDWDNIKRDRSLLWQQIKRGPSKIGQSPSSQNSEEHALSTKP